MPGYNTFSAGVKRIYWGPFLYFTLRAPFCHFHRTTAV